jgi:hypothetical protein
MIEIPCEESSYFDVNKILKKIDDKGRNSAPRERSGNQSSDESHIEDNPEQPRVPEVKESYMSPR